MVPKVYLVFIMTLSCCLLQAEANASKEHQDLLQKRLSQIMKQVARVREMRQRAYGNVNNTEEVTFKVAEYNVSDYSKTVVDGVGSHAEEKTASITWNSALKYWRSKIAELAPGLTTFQWRPQHYFYLAIGLLVKLS